MAFSKKKLRRKRRKKGIVFILFVISALIFRVFTIIEAEQKVEILYFRNDGCVLISNTDQLIQQAIQTFNKKIKVEVFNARLYPSEPPDLPEIEELRKKYQVIGLPEIIINGKKFIKNFTKENLFTEICNNFIVKPEVCK